MEIFTQMQYIYVSKETCYFEHSLAFIYGRHNSTVPKITVLLTYRSQTTFLKLFRIKSSDHKKTYTSCNMSLFCTLSILEKMYRVKSELHVNRIGGILSANCGFLHCDAM
jgi:hypothetical protein